MKKLLSLLLILVLIPNIMHARGKPEFGWNNAISASIGYAKVHKPFFQDSYGNNMPTELLGLDVNIFGVYFGGGFGSKKTGYDVYGFEEKLGTYIFHLGPSFRLRWGSDDCKLVFAPYALWGRCILDDTSGNAIGQRQDYGPRKDVFGAGLKLTFAYKYFEIGAYGSNRDFGIHIGVNCDFD